MPKKSKLPPPPIENLARIPVQRAFREVLDVCKPRGYKLIREGKLRTFKDGSKRYTTHEDCKACVELQRQEGAAA